MLYYLMMTLTIGFYMTTPEFWRSNYLIEFCILLRISFRRSRLRLDIDEDLNDY